MGLEVIWQPDTQQRIFRKTMEAMARPGHLVDLAADVGAASAVLGVLAALLDGSVSLCDRHKLLRDADWPLLQAVSKAPDQADFVLCNGANPPDFEPKIGTLTSPELSATLLLRVEAIGRHGCGLRLSGPGIEERSLVYAAGLDPAWLGTRQRWVSGFPLGVDMIVADQAGLFVLPRTTKVEVH